MGYKDFIISINIVIADRPYPLKIKRSEEDKVRKAAKIINDKVRDFQLHYGGKDKQDFLAMASLQFMLEKLNSSEHSPTINPSAIAKIDQIQQVLQDALNEA